MQILYGNVILDRMRNFMEFIGSSYIKKTAPVRAGRRVTGIDWSDSS